MKMLKLIMMLAVVATATHDVHAWPWNSKPEQKLPSSVCRRDTHCNKDSIRNFGNYNDCMTKCTATSGNFVYKPDIKAK